MQMLEYKELLFQNRVVFEKVTVSANFVRFPKVFKENESCFMFVRNGNFIFRTPEQTLQFHAGDAMLSKCGNYFFETNKSVVYKEGDTISAIAAYFYPDMIKQLIQEDKYIHPQKNYDSKKISVEPLLIAFVDSINYLLDNPMMADEGLIVNKLKELVLLLSKSDQSNSLQEFISALFAAYHYSFDDVIQNNINSNLSLVELAQLCHCSVSTFKRKFVELYQEAPARYLLKKRLENAVSLLMQRSISITDIAYRCGFDSVSSFNRAFKRQYGKTPTEYRG